MASTTHNDGAHSPVTPPAPTATLNVHTIGHIAQQALSRTSHATVIGVTSRGIFLQCAKRQIVFISYEVVRNPLVLNMTMRNEGLEAIATADDAHVQNEILLFHATGLRIRWTEATVWRAPAPGMPPVPRSQQYSALATALQQQEAFGAARGFGPLLPHLLALPNTPQPDTSQQAILDRITALQAALQARHMPAAMHATERLLGLGPGLTASGDDFLMGLLLFLRRWPSDRLPHDWWQSYARNVVRAAYHLTTTISANLIECAALGQADERLIAACDAIATSTGPADHWLQPLTTWGASSGIDALAGVALALTLWQPSTTSDTGK